MHIVPEGNYKIRIQEYAATVFELLPSRSAVKKALKKEQLYIDKKVATSASWICAGQEIHYVKANTVMPKIFPLVLEVLYEDPYLAVVFKPAGYPTSGNYYKTIEHALPHNLTVSTEKDALAYPIPVHRLDKPTSGLLLIAKTAGVQRALHHKFFKNEIEKEYHAILARLFPNNGTISFQINDKAATTQYTVIKRIKSLQNDYLSLVKFQPKTGRTHQLRKHAALLGSPIVGDRLYAGDDIMKHKGLFLCATQLIFEHPIFLKTLTITTALPKKFNSYLQREERRFKKYNT